MKKIKGMLLLSAILSLTGCNDIDKSESQSTCLDYSSIPASDTSSDATTSESSTTESSSSTEASEESSSSAYVEPEIIVDKACFDIGSRNQAEIYAHNEIYVYKDEPYYFGKILDIKVSYKTNLDEYLTISEDGVITVTRNDAENTIKGDLYIYNDSVYQKITLIIDREEYKHQHMSVDIARLYNSNVIFFGDSITHNWLKYPSGDDSNPNDVSGTEYGELGYEYNYTVQITKKCSLNSAVNAAWSGGTVAYLPRSRERFPYKSLVMGVINHEEDVKNADYAFIFYGTNDYTDQVEIGEIDDPIDITSRTNANFKTSYNFAINKLYEYNPNIKIIVLNIMYRTYPSSGSFFQMKNYNAAIDEVCEVNHVKVIDMSTLFKFSNFKKTGGLYTDDGLHPNKAGYNIITDYILTGVNNAKDK